MVFNRTASLDVEPVYTFRAHSGPVLCLAVDATGEHCYSGGFDASIRCWSIPNSNIDPYDSFGKCRRQCLLGSASRFICLHMKLSIFLLVTSYIFDFADPSVLSDTLVAHTDAVWGLSIHSSKMQLLSCSSDGTVRLWSPGSKSPLLNTFRAENGRPNNWYK